MHDSLLLPNYKNKLKYHHKNTSSYHSYAIHSITLLFRRKLSLNSSQISNFHFPSNKNSSSALPKTRNFFALSHSIECRERLFVQGFCASSERERERECVFLFFSSRPRQQQRRRCELSEWLLFCRFAARLHVYVQSTDFCGFAMNIYCAVWCDSQGHLGINGVALWVCGCDGVSMQADLEFRENNARERKEFAMAIECVALFNGVCLSFWVAWAV